MIEQTDKRYHMIYLLMDWSLTGTLVWHRTKSETKKLSFETRTKILQLKTLRCILSRFVAIAEKNSARPEFDAKKACLVSTDARCINKVEKPGASFDSTYLYKSSIRAIK